MPVDFQGKFAFSPENRYAIGVEEEVWTVNLRTGVLVPAALKIFAPGYEKRHPWLKPELPNQQIEAVTPICRSLAEVQHSLAHNDGVMHAIARKLEVRISREPVPVKPHSVSVYPSKRFLDIQERVGERIGGAYVAGLHVHIGVGSPNEAVLALNTIRQYLPELLSLSARSKRLVGGKKYVSFRYIKYREMAGEVVPPFLRHWGDFETAALSGGFFEDPRKCWWGARINPHGTVELRICDVQDIRSLTLTLVALARVLVRAAIEGLHRGSPVPADLIEDRLLSSAEGQCGVTPFILLANDLATRLHATDEAVYIRRLLV